MNKIGLLAVVAALTFSAAASAAVTFNGDTGAGTVTKADIQLAFGWNNQTVFANANGVTFVYRVTDAYKSQCTLIADGVTLAQVYYSEHSQSLGVSGTANFTARPKSQYTGHTLTGFDDSYTEAGNKPVVGAPCGSGGTWTDVHRINSTGGLYAKYGTLVALLPPPSPVFSAPTR